jgi:hypothetical protein
MCCLCSTSPAQMVQANLVALQAFVGKVSTTYPASSFLQPGFAASLCFQQILDGCAWTAAHVRDARNNFPALHALMTSLQTPTLPAELQPFLQQLKSRALKLQEIEPVSGCIMNCRNSKVTCFFHLSQCHSPEVVRSDIEDSHVYMPMFPLLRYLPKWAVSKSPADKESTACSKYWNTHTGLTPGVFTFFCPHDVCLGFKLMHKHEGPSTVHDTLFTRLETGIPCLPVAVAPLQCCSGL